MKSNRKKVAIRRRAVLEAWKRERQLVREGKGTRDWTPQQQMDILKKGKAFDENGVAFQGHHMKSVSKFPEYQGDYKNIQFLTKAEHLEAHGGSWKNPSNWYFDPKTNERKPFGNEKYIPCKIINMTNPIYIN